MRRFPHPVRFKDYIDQLKAELSLAPSMKLISVELLDEDEVPGAESSRLLMRDRPHLYEYHKPEYNNDENLEHEQDEDICAVCHEELEPGDQMRGLPCTHSLHKHCLESWIHKMPTCPICRAAIWTDVECVVALPRDVFEDPEEGSTKFHHKRSKLEDSASQTWEKSP